MTNDTLTYNSALNRLEKTIENNEILLNLDITSKISMDALHSLVSTSFHSFRIYKIDNTTYLNLSKTGFLETGAYADIFKGIKPIMTKNIFPIHNTKNGRRTVG